MTVSMEMIHMARKINPNAKVNGDVKTTKPVTCHVIKVLWIILTCACSENKII